jgi:hypothetical protein
MNGNPRSRQNYARLNPHKKKAPTPRRTLLLNKTKNHTPDKITDDPIYIWGRGRHLRAKRSSQQLLIVENQKHSILKTHAKV